MDTQTAEKPLINPYLTLFIGITALSTGAIFVRLADAPPLVIAAYRLLMVSTVLLPLALIKQRDELFSMTLPDLRQAMLSGFFLSLHFATWITSLSYTSVSNSVVLVNTNPLWVGLLTPLITKERISRGLWIGIGLSTVGCVIIGAGDIEQSGSALFGDFLAILGSISAAFYLLIGRNLRRRFSLLTYITVCYGSSAVFLWAAVFAFSLKITGLTPATWGAIVGLALFAQLMGHTSFNWALKWFSAGFIAISLLGEPVGSTIFAYFILTETPKTMDLIGGVIILIGIYKAAKSE